MLLAASGCSRLWLRSHRAQQQLSPLLGRLRSSISSCAVHSKRVMCSNDAHANGDGAQVREASPNAIAPCLTRVTEAFHNAMPSTLTVNVQRSSSFSGRPSDPPLLTALVALVAVHLSLLLWPQVYQPFRFSGEAAERDWVQHLELDTARAMADAVAGEPLKVLVLYGSLRQRSYSKLLAYEFGR